MASPFATSKVTVEYFDPHGLFKLIAPGLEARLPLRHLHWQSHSGPLRSIDTLHVELVAAGENSSSIPQLPAVFDQKHSDYDAAIVDSFSTTAVGGLLRSTTNNVITNTARDPRMG
ncbi:tmem1 family [Niveomyces insectorum RCEF 264]|uniref:Tmem1 family n=1 Tax=Niveomyces insectorum RCEF 264 TaxID=1081102 RepID=A0A167M621_9HYPO|nr:tmem1 family [Niveomyces insectorum RCEF 264]